ncbi:MAG TPA: L-threonylcarbamoyladenylate synthase [Bacteroidota bacterium]|nr:L-threonylcarbamoyladenylate synthase [Bacteroidota bacterium]
MRTVHTESPRKAAVFIRQGEIVAFPTETVYGLGANVFDEQALRKIFAAKKRPADNPFIVHVARIEEIELLARRIPHSAEKLIQRFFPGPLTVIVPKQRAVPRAATAGLSTVGIRMPRHPVAHAFLKACGVPVAAPSANLSGSPSSTTWRSVSFDLDGRISCILKGGQTSVGLESTVVDCTGAVPEVLRSGAVTLEQLREIIPSTRIAIPRSAKAAKSPGTKYRHYSPRARVIIVADAAEIGPTTNAAFIGTGALINARRFRFHRILPNVNAYAHELFYFFRLCDAAGVSKIYCQAVEPSGLGLALMDRITRAAH